MSVEFSEHVSQAIKREFIEEAMNSSEEGAKHVDQLFKTAVSVRHLECVQSLVIDRVSLDLPRLRR